MLVKHCRKRMTSFTSTHVKSVMRPSLIICAVLVLSTLGFSRYIVRVVSSQSRILSADHDGLVAKAPDAKTTPTPTTLLTFTAGTILTNPPEALDSVVQVAQQNGQVTITPRANVTGLHYNGVVSNETVDLTTRSLDVEVKQTTKNGAETIFAVGTDFNNFYRFRKVDPGTTLDETPSAQFELSPNGAGAYLIFEVDIQGAYSASRIPFDPGTHAFWPFNGNAQNSIEFQTSSDQITWTKQYSISIANNLAVAQAARVELSAGTSSSVSDPGSAIFQIRPLNDNFANAQSIAGTAGSLPTSNVGATKELGEPNHRGQVGGASVWYRWQAPLSSGVVFGLERPIFGFGLPNLFLDVYSCTSLTNLTAVPSFISGRDQSLTTRTFRATAGTTYYIAVDGVNVSTTDFIDLFWNQITNDDFANAKRIDLSDFASGASFHGFAATHGATKEPGEPDHAGSPGGASVWYLWQPPVDCTIQVDTDGSYFDTLLAVYTGPNVSNLVVIANDDDGIKPSSRLRFKAQAGVTYYIAVDDKNGRGGGLDLHLRVLSTSDDFNSAQLITGASGSINGSNISATKEPGEPNHGGNIGGASVWYRWQAPVSGSAYFTATGRTETFDAFDALLGIYRGSIVNALSLVTGNDDDYLGGPGSRVGFNVVGGTTYLIAVDGYNGAQSDFALNWWTSGDSIPTSAAPACLPKPRGLSYWDS